MPAMIVSLVSWSKVTTKVGSSIASACSATPSFSLSPRLLGLTATEMTGAGKSIDSSVIGWAGSQSVSPVRVSVRPTQATMSPACASSSGSCLFACMRKRREMRCSLSIVESSISSPSLSVPE